MATKTFSPKIEIINYFDELINQLDIEIEETIKKYNENQTLGDLKCLEKHERTAKIEKAFYKIIKIFKSQQNDEKEQQTLNLWSESTKAVDYLSQIRMRTIEELRKAQEDNLEYYKLNSSRFKAFEEMSDEFRSQLFGEKFYFQVRLKSKEFEPLIFKLFTFVTDFYMSQSDIYILEYFLRDVTITDFLADLEMFDAFDEKAVLINLLLIYFLDNLSNIKYSSHVISVSKQESVNIKEILYPFVVRRVKLNSSLIDLSKLERLTFSYIGNSDEIELDGLLSLQYLHLSLNSLERFSARNLPSLKYFIFDCQQLNNSLSTEIFGHLSIIVELEIKGIFSDINMDDLVNLEKLSISGKLEENFNFDLFKNLCNHLKDLSICKMNIDDEKLAKLFQSHNFPNLEKLKIAYCEITKLEKKLFEGFPTLQFLTIINPYENSNKQLRVIKNDAFSNLTNLVSLNLHGNSIETIDQSNFSGLTNLMTLVLSFNRIECIEDNTFSDLNNLKKLDLSRNNLSILNPKFFIGLENLEYLDLKSNKLKYFDLRNFDHISNINKIVLLNNPILNRNEILTLNKSGKTKRNSNLFII